MGKKFSSGFEAICAKYAYEISTDKNLKDTFKIKRSDKNTPNFKQIPLRKYFEKKAEDKYTRSSIHGVKGESYDAVLIYVKRPYREYNYSKITDGGGSGPGTYAFGLCSND